MNPKDRFHNAIDFFYEKNYHLAGQASKLGYPKMVSGYPPTAAIMWNKERRKVEFVFNSTFSDSINDTQFNFAVAHEVTHVINGHVFIMKSEVDRLRAQGATEKDIAQWTQKFNKAADCVVNDTLVNLYGMPRCEFPNDNGDCGILYGKNIVGCDCHDLSVIDVMSLLPETDDDAGGIDNHGMWESFFNEDGSINRDFVDVMQDFLDDNMDNAAASEEDAQKIEELQRSMQDCSDSYARQAGRSTSSSMKRVQAHSAAIRWERILFRKVERHKFEDRWNRRNRKMEGFPQDLILPVSQAKEVEDIFIAIDVSGSIDWKALELFVSVVKNTPKHFSVNAITFNTSCRPFDIHSDTVRSGGGTNFHIIENYIQENFRKYPKAVFVLTDGCGSNVSPQYPDRWTWMLYGACYSGHCKNMSNYNLESLLK